MSLALEGKTVLVTGVSRGVGLATAKAILDAGGTVMGLSRTFTGDLESLQEQSGDRLYWMAFDLADTDAIRQRIFQEFIPLSKPLHGVVNNAAIAYDDLITNLQQEPLQKMYAVNVVAPMMIVREALRNMVLHHTAGSIVHVSSISVHTGYKGLAMYASTKGALEAFSKNTAREWGVRGIRSNCVVPGFMETEMSASLSDEQRQRIYRRTALGRATSVAGVAEMIAYLLSDRAESVTGQNLFIDSGTI